MMYTGTFAATVEANNDPECLGRVKARAPAVYGPAAATDAVANSIPTDSLPWAMPAGLPAGGSAESGAIVWVPKIGDHVYLRFLDGLPEKPIWEWAMQDRSQAAAYPYWKESGYGSGQPPEQAILTRYGHSVEINKDYVQVRVAKGFLFRLRATGEIEVWATDINVLPENVSVAGMEHKFTPVSLFSVDTTHMQVSATNVDVQAKTNTIGAIVENLIRAPHIELGPSGSAVDPVVRLSDLQRVLTTLMTVFNTHLHIGNLGRPTSPPTVPMVLVPTGSSTTFTA